MSDPLRSEHGNARPLSDAEREARIEQLLLSGLDQYFAGRYEQAIDIWTRVAFLERGHGRARAYIERARSALAERQRESEELVQTGVAAYHAGNLDEARALLTRAVDEGGLSDTALMFLQHLSRLDRAAGHVQIPAGERPDHAVAPAPVPRRWPATLLASAFAAAVVIVAAIPVGSWLADLPINAPVVPVAPEPLPVVRPSDVLLARARVLSADGHLRDALRLLDRIDLADPARADGDRLKADIQRMLLATVHSSNVHTGKRAYSQ
jgi:tetratricopeptide (TPR) repeat protein